MSVNRATASRTTARTTRGTAVLTALLIAVSGAARAQEPPADEAVPAVEAAPKPRPKPKPKPAPRRKPAAAPAAPSADAPAEPPAASRSPTSPEPAPAPTLAANLQSLTVACAGKAALYDGGKDTAVWVTRTGVIAVENPLRPLTPETTRVLQVVIGGKVATAYGPDLFALRRGGPPAALEARTGGPLRWDAEAVPLPDTLNIVSETGQPVAQLAFQSCGEAPAVQAVAGAKSAGGQGKAKGRPKAASPQAPPGIGIPQGALSEGALQ